MALAIPQQYVEQGAFDQAINRLDRAISDVVNKLDSTTSKLEQAIEVVSAKNRDAVERERLEREANIEKIRSDVEAGNRRTDERLTGIDNKLDTMTNVLGRLTGVMEGVGETLKAREMIFADDRTRIEKLESVHQSQENGIALITSTQAAMSGKLDDVTGAIWGDTSKPDAAPSLNRMLMLLDGKVQVVLETNKSGAARLDLLEKASLAEKQKWARRKEVAIGAAKSLRGNSIFMVLVGIALVALVVGLFPSAATTISEIVVILFGQ